MTQTAKDENGGCPSVKSHQTNKRMSKDNYCIMNTNLMMALGFVHEQKVPCNRNGMLSKSILRSAVLVVPYILYKVNAGLIA